MATEFEDRVFLIDERNSRASAGDFPTREGGVV